MSRRCRSCHRWSHGCARQSVERPSGPGAERAARDACG
ncbi:Uncharacterised protein [Amycolatopsis camponoti]|uniref:Uncharacterized protein n=1 Tax=Amycolatopsis camponoti TaxID=2606593 RepID=A0A6I8LQ56_9PSEU|nr:Uncharacterised protein [Amycolatopsis camponoti]